VPWHSAISSSRQSSSPWSAWTSLSCPQKAQRVSPGDRPNLTTSLGIADSVPRPTNSKAPQQLPTARGAIGRRSRRRHDQSTRPRPSLQAEAVADLPPLQRPDGDDGREGRRHEDRRGAVHRRPRQHRPDGPTFRGWPALGRPRRRQPLPSPPLQRCIGEHPRFFGRKLRSEEGAPPEKPSSSEYFLSDIPA